MPPWSSVGTAISTGGVGQRCVRAADFGTDDCLNLPDGFQYIFTFERWHPEAAADADTNADGVRGGAGDGPVLDASASLEVRSFPDEPDNQALFYTDESWSGSFGSPLGSDGVIAADLPDSPIVYARMRLRFQDDHQWESLLVPPPRGTAIQKFVRFSVHLDQQTPTSVFNFFPDGDTAPLSVFDFLISRFGTNGSGAPNETRFNHALRCGPLVQPIPDPNTGENNYWCQFPAPRGADASPTPPENQSTDTNVDRFIIGESTDTSVIGGQPAYFDLGTSTNTPDFSEGLGDGEWHLIEFEVRLNTAPGVADGSARLWLDGQLEFDNDRIPWVGSAAAALPAGFNKIMFGGNSINNWAPEVDMPEQHYAIDDIEVFNVRRCEANPPELSIVQPSP